MLRRIDAVGVRRAAVSEMVQILIMAAVAGVVLARLYAVLGKRTGAPPPEPKPQPVGVGLGSDTARAQAAPRPLDAPTPGVEAVQAADPNFDPQQFLRGARGAYELIVTAFSKGDRATLQPLLTPPVFSAYAAALDQRGDAPGPELVRLKSAELADSEVEGSMARIDVRFEAELAEGETGVRDTRERWSFERDLRAKDPTWRLAAVAQA